VRRVSRPGLHYNALMRSFVVAVALASTVLTLQANVVIPAEFREVVRDSSVIVRGRVTDVRSVVVPDRGIESIATVAVETKLKGDAPTFVYVRVPGGEVGRSKVVMVGAPTLRVGDRAVFFLRAGGADSTMLPIGLSQGIYRVQAEPQTGRPVVAPPLVGGVTENRSGPAMRGDTRRKLMPVTEFEGLVRLVVASTAAVPRVRGGAR